LSSDDRKKQEKLLKVALSKDLAYVKVRANLFQEKTKERADHWNATCNLGLKVYMKNEESTIEVLWDTSNEGEGRSKIVGCRGRNQNWNQIIRCRRRKPQFYHWNRRRRHCELESILVMGYSALLPKECRP
jgi:hypothetical protein